MIFMVQCFDKPDSLDLRMETRPAHLEHAASLGDNLLLAGPMLNQETGKPMGSLLLIDVEDRAAADAFAEADPYAQAGLFEVVMISPWMAAAGSWKPAD